MSALPKRISFPVNEHGWVLLFQVFGKKTILRAYDAKDKGRKSDDTTQHRMCEFEFEGGVKVRSKLYDTSLFPESSVPDNPAGGLPLGMEDNQV